MSELAQRLEADFLQAVKSKNQEKVNTLRLIKAVLTNEKIAKKAELDDSDIIKILKKEVKKRQEAITAYTAGGRDDLKAREQQELEIIKSYLPKELSDQELKKLVEKIIKENDFKDFGQAMKTVMAELKDQADGSRVSQLVRELLT